MSVYKKQFLFDEVTSNPFFIFSYYLGSLPIKDFLAYKEMCSSKGIRFIRFKESDFHVDKKIVYPLLQGSFCFFLPKTVGAKEISPKDLGAFLDMISKDKYNYFFPACIGNSTYVLSFKSYSYFYKYGLKFRRFGSVGFPQSTALFVLKFVFLFLKALIALQLRLLFFTNGYYKSIN